MEITNIRDTDHLEQLLSSPSRSAVEAMQRISGDVMLLGAGGKMGPSLARMIRNASNQAGVERKVIAVSRFTDSEIPSQLVSHGIDTIQGDLLDSRFLTSLPDCPNVIFMTGAKFGTSKNASMTWAMNVMLPSRVCEKFVSSRKLAFSTGNVYPFVDVEGDWSVEADTLEPVGEYGMSAVGRERMFEYSSILNHTPTTIVRLNYAVDMRYGVLVDLATKVLTESEIDLSMGFANVIWQGDANSLALAAMGDASSPPFIVNVAGRELLDVKVVCEAFGRIFGKRPRFSGEPTRTALLNNAAEAHRRYGEPAITIEKLVAWTADWLLRGQPTWQKPTHFEIRSGQF